MYKVFKIDNYEFRVNERGWGTVVDVYDGRPIDLNISTMKKMIEAYEKEFFKRGMRASCNLVEDSCTIDKITCKECLDKDYWSKILDRPNTIIYNQEIYYFTENSKDGGYNKTPFTIIMLDGTIYKHVGLWANGKIPSELNVKDNCMFIKEEK